MEISFDCFSPRIDKEYLFSKGINQETIMSYYTGHNVHSKKLYKSILRQDNHVTVSYFKSKSDILYYHDFATNDCLNCFEVVMHIYGCNYFEALNIIAKDFGLLNQDKPNIKIPIIEEVKETERAKIQVQLKEFTDNELVWWKQFGITPKILNKYNIYSLQHVFLNDKLTFSSNDKYPIYGYYFGKDNKGLEKWKIYMPLANKDKGIRFIGNLNKNLLQGYRQLPNKGKLLVINKSMKDTAACYALGIPSVSPNSETSFPTKKQIEEFKERFEHIIVIFDNDKAGLHNLWKQRKQFPELDYFWIPKEYGAKDLTDLIKLLGFDKVKELTKQFLTNYKFKMLKS